VLVFLNTRAGHGRAAARWRKVSPELERRAGAFGVEEVGPFDCVQASVREAVAKGERAFIAAGGDGTVNLLLNAIMELGDRVADITIGAVGLGSSNDFHKPHGPDSVIAGVPVRIDCKRAKPCDVIRVDFEERDGQKATRHAIINASLGITAEANAAFNEPTGFIRAARRLSVDAAIIASIIHTLATYRDIDCRLVIDGMDEGTFPISSLGIIKNPHFAGSMCYDTPIEPDDGQLGINLCEGLNPFQALMTVAALHRRRFRGRPKTRSWVGKSVVVEADRTFALETDGQVVEALSVAFSVLPGRIMCCR